MTDNDSDPVKKIFGKTAQEIFSTPKESHSNHHSSNAFCGNAGPEEMKHFQDLLEKLTDSQLVTLVNATNVHFGASSDEIDREVFEGILDEVDREDFYREYRKLV